MTSRAIVAAALALAAVACKSDKQPAARELRKMDVHALIDEGGRLKLTFRLFDAKHEPLPITGSYSAEVTRPDGTPLCKASGALSPADFSAKGVHQPRWDDAGCPADPGVDELKLNVTLTAKAGGAAKAGEGDQDDKGGKGGKDKVIERSITAAVKTIYERPPVKPPAAGSGSDAGSASGSAASSGSGAGSGSAATGSAAASAEKPDPSAKPAAPSPAPAKPAAPPPAPSKP